MASAREAPAAARRRNREGRCGAVSSVVSGVFASGGLCADPTRARGRALLPCQAEPATIAHVSDDFGLLLAHGRRATPGRARVSAGAGVDARRGSDAAHRLVGRRARSSSSRLRRRPDRWGGLPAQAIAPSSEGRPRRSSRSASVMIGEGLARYRPDRAATPCAKAYLQAETLPRARKVGVWQRIRRSMRQPRSEESLAALAEKEGDDRARRQCRLYRRDDGRHLSEFRQKSRPRRLRRDFPEECAYIPRSGMDSPFAARAGESASAA